MRQNPKILVYRHGRQNSCKYSHLRNVNEMHNESPQVRRTWLCSIVNGVSPCSMASGSANQL